MCVVCVCVSVCVCVCLCVCAFLESTLSCYTNAFRGEVNP